MISSAIDSSQLISLLPQMLISFLFSWFSIFVIYFIAFFLLLNIYTTTALDETALIFSFFIQRFNVCFFFLFVRFCFVFFTIFQKIFLSSLDKCVVIVLTTFTLALMRWQSGEHLYDTVRDASWRLL